MTLAKVAYYLVDMGTITLTIGFVLVVAHTALLAFGRRPALVPATAGAHGGGGSSRPSVGPVDPPAGSTGQLFVVLSFALVGLGMLVRAYLVGRGPWGNLYEFSVAFAFGI